MKDTKVTQYLTMYCSVLLDLCVTARPVRLGHVIYPFMEGLSYATFSLVYWALGGTGAGATRWIYPMLNWGEQPGTAALTVLGCAAGEESSIRIIEGSPNNQKFYRPCFHSFTSVDYH